MKELSNPNHETTKKIIQKEKIPMQDNEANVKVSFSITNEIK